MSGAPTHYERLGVSETASGVQIRIAYRRLARKYHPDSALPGQANEPLLVILTEAYEVLRDEDERLRYNATLHDSLTRSTSGKTRTGPPGHAETASTDVKSADLSDHVTQEPFLPALGKLFWRLLQAGARALPQVFQRGPRVVLIGGGLILAVLISSWALRSFTEYVEQSEFERTLPRWLTETCDGRSDIGEDLPTGSKAALDCTFGGVSVTYFVTEDDYADRYFARHLRRAKKETRIVRGSAGSCTKPGHVTTYRYRDGFGLPGRVFCWVDAGNVTFEWVEGSTYVQATSDQPYAQVYQWWRTKAGPFADQYAYEGNISIRKKIR